MSVLSSELLESFKETIDSQKAESIDALNRTFDGSFDIEVIAEGPFSSLEVAEKLDSEGLVLGMSVDDQGLLFILPQLDGFVPEWCKDPDPTGESKLATLAQELGMTMVPEDAMPMDFAAKYVKEVAAANSAAKLADDATGIVLQLKNGDQSAPAVIVWPAATPLEMKSAEGVESDSPPQAAEPSDETLSAPNTEQSEEESSAAPKQDDLQLQLLPAYTRSLLKVEIPMCVTLVKAKKPIGKIRELGPGAIIQFEKNCDDPITLEANGRKIAEGSAVRVGEHFGIEVSKILMPEEHFWTVQKSGRTAG